MSTQGVQQQTQAKDTISTDGLQQQQNEMIQHSARPTQQSKGKAAEQHPEFNLSNFPVLSPIQTKNGFEALTEGTCGITTLPVDGGGGGGCSNTQV